MDLQWRSTARTGSSSSHPIIDEGGVELIGSHRDIASFSGGATGVELVPELYNAVSGPKL